MPSQHIPCGSLPQLTPEIAVLDLLHTMHVHNRAAYALAAAQDVQALKVKESNLRDACPTLVCRLACHGVYLWTWWGAWPPAASLRQQPARCGPPESS